MRVSPVLCQKLFLQSLLLERLYSLMLYLASHWHLQLSILLYHVPYNRRITIFQSSIMTIIMQIVDSQAIGTKTKLVNKSNVAKVTNIYTELVTFQRGFGNYIPQMRVHNS